MSQAGWTNLVAATDDGTKFVEQINAFADAVLTSHAGTTRPSYVKQGMIWVDNSASPELVLNLFDGVYDREVIRVTPGGSVMTGEQSTVWSEVIPGHDLAPGIAVQHNGTSWVRAKADSDATLAEALVRAVSGTRVTFQQLGLIDSLTGLSPGSTYYLSAATAGQITTVRPTSGYAQVVMVAMSASRALVVCGPGITVDGFLVKKPGIGTNVVQANHADAWPMMLQRRADQRAGLLALLNESGTGLGGIDANGYPWGTMAPAVQVPIGGMMLWPFDTPPAGWLKLDGAVIPSQYTTLRAWFGNNMPDFRGRNILVSYPAGGFATLTGGGAYTAALSVNHLPNTTNIVSGVAIAGAPHGGNNGEIFPSTRDDEPAYKINVTSFRGGGASFSVLNPYVALVLIMRGL